jgi:hypothetical protein
MHYLLNYSDDVEFLLFRIIALAFIRCIYLICCSVMVELCWGVVNPSPNLNLIDFMCPWLRSLIILFYMTWNPIPIPFHPPNHSIGTCTSYWGSWCHRNPKSSYSRSSPLRPRPHWVNQRRQNNQWSSISDLFIYLFQGLSLVIDDSWFHGLFNWFI